MKMNYDLAVRVRVSMVNKNIITFHKEKSTCTSEHFCILPTYLKFNYHQFCYLIL